MHTNYTPPPPRRHVIRLRKAAPLSEDACATRTPWDCVHPVRAGLALLVRYSSAMATIQVRDVPDDVAETYRRRAQASGQSLQSYMREQLITMARRRDKAEMMAVVEQVLAQDPAPGLRGDTIQAGLRELRGE